MSAAESHQVDPADAPRSEDAGPTETDRAVRRVLTATEWADFREWLRSVA